MTHQIHAKSRAKKLAQEVVKEGCVIEEVIQFRTTDGELFDNPEDAELYAAAVKIFLGADTVEESKEAWAEFLRIRLE